MGTQIDWSKAGKRLRRTPSGPQYGGRNPDWNDRLSRWKVAEEYAGEELTPERVIAMADCPLCGGYDGGPCLDARIKPMDYPHAERVFAAGAARIAAGEFAL